MRAGGPVRRRRSAGLIAAAVLALFATAATAADTGAPATGRLSFSLPQARAAMHRSGREGNIALARQLALAVIEANPEDGEAQYVLAQSARRLNRPAEAYRAATAAYRLAETDLQRFQSAQIAATTAYETSRLTMAQLWLRRGHDAAPTDASRTAIARDFRRLRRINPLLLELSFHFSPSSNVNNGSDDSLNYIDGVPLVGLLSPSAQALSGLEYGSDLRGRYRLTPPGTRTELSLHGRYYLRKVRLSSEAREAAPTARNGDFAFSVAEMALRGRHALGERSVASLGLAIGRAWYGGEPNFDFGRLEAGWQVAAGERTRLGLRGFGELRRDTADRDSQVLQASVFASHFTPTLGTFTTTLSLRDHESVLSIYSSRSVSARVEWQPAKQVGPVTLDLALEGTYSDYPDFRVGIISVPGGRQDRSLAASMNLGFPDVSYRGFIPELTVAASRTRSNVSRFDTTELSLGLGIRSAF